MRKHAEGRFGEDTMEPSTGHDARMRKAGGAAALYLALAYIAAMPYFLLVVDYRGAKGAAEKVALVVGNHASMYAMYLATYVVFGIALAVLVFALHDRLAACAPASMRIAGAIGLMWAFTLVAGGMVFTYGITTVVALAGQDPAGAAIAWQAIEPVALGLGGAGGEILGGLWVLLTSLAILKGGSLPRIGIVVGAAGLASGLPPLRDAAMLFGLLQIPWFILIGAALSVSKPMAGANVAFRSR